MAEYAKLFTPVKIGKMELKNRITLPPMACGFATEDGYITDQFVDYYGERAKGGAAMIVIESSYPRPAGYPRRPNLSSEKFLPGLTKLADAIHKGGAKACVQILPHKGRNDLVDPATASEALHPTKGTKIRALKLDEIKRLIDEFAYSVKLLQKAGFDCVEIHGGSGYLLSEFFSPRLNKRDDEYGGDARRRARLALDMIKAGKQAAGADYPIIYRMVADERVGEEGFVLRDAIIAAQNLEEGGADAIDVVSGSTVETFAWLIPYMYMHDGCNVDLSDAIKKKLKKVPVGVAGKILDASLADQILKEGKADFVDMGRALIVDPYFPAKVQAGKTDDVLRCVACLRCAESILSATDYRPSGGMLCSVNPAVGREHEFEVGLKPATKKRNVLVLGGGPGGMEAAAVAARRGHKVTLWEKSDKLGGLLNFAVVPPGKDDLKTFVPYLTREMAKYKVKVQLSKEATVDEVVKFKPDAVIVASGSTPLVPKIKGLDKRKLVTFKDVLSEKVKVGKRVVIIGGGFVGCEVADFLAEKGKKVTVIEILPTLASELFPPVAEQVVRKMKEAGDVTVYCEVKEEEITEKGINIVTKDGKKVTIDADDVVIAAGSRADTSLFDSLKGKITELYQVGDCAKARRIQETVSEGAAAGLKV